MKHTFFGNFPCLPYQKDIEQYALELQRNFSTPLNNAINIAIHKAYHLTNEEVFYISSNVEHY